MVREVMNQLQVICTYCINMFRKVIELNKIIKEKDEILNNLKKDLISAKEVYDVKLSVSNKEITILKENLSAVKKLKDYKESDAEKLKRKLIEARQEMENLSKINKSLQSENDRFMNIIAGSKTSPTNTHKRVYRKC